MIRTKRPANMLRSGPMAQPFDAELEELVSKFSRELADQIRSLILRRLGIERAPASRPSPKAAPARSAPVSTPARVKRAPSTSRAPATVRAPVSERRHAARPSTEERAASIERIARIVANGSGLSVGEIERQSGFTRSAVGSALKALKDQGRIFMGGTKRFARYATTQATADQASLEARRGAAA
jgi:DNA-binding transcriptional ArsR family regulator